MTLHTLRHTALSRMIAAGFDDFTVMGLSGHCSVRMLSRYAHPTEERKVGALDSFDVVTTRSQSDRTPNEAPEDASFSPAFIGGRHEARTRDLSVANAALSQLS